MRERKKWWWRRRKRRKGRRDRRNVGGRERGREGGRERGREEGREGGREGGREEGEGEMEKGSDEDEVGLLFLDCQMKEKVSPEQSTCRWEGQYEMPHPHSLGTGLASGKLPYSGTRSRLCERE